MKHQSKSRENLLLEFAKYGTPEYWKKERKSKFVRNYRKNKREDLEVINLWNVLAGPPPLYTIELLNNVCSFENKDGTYTWSTIY